MDLELADSVAVVVGAAQGIGRSVATLFAREGADLACVDLAEGVESVAEELAATHGVKARGWTGDVTDGARMKEIAAAVKETFGKYDHVVCTAGIGSGKFGFPFWNLEPDDWDRVIRVNLLGSVHVAHAFSPHLVERRTGSILFFSSVAGQIGSQTDPPYSAAKAGVINFTQCAAKDLAPYRVRVNCICPGMVKTSLNRSVWEAWARQQPESERQTYEEWAGTKIDQVVPLGEWQEEEDVAAMSVFLASRRTKSVTGQTINVDGGFVMHC